MLQHQKHWISAAAFLAVPLAFAGCGGGGGNGRPRATATPIGTTSSTPSATATPSGTTIPATFSITANFSQASGALPFAVRYTDGTARLITTPSGFKDLNATFGTEDAAPDVFPQPIFNLSVATSGTIRAGDSFPLTLGSNNTSGASLLFNDTRDSPPLRQFFATSGTYRINSVVNTPATTTQQATLTVNFTLSNVILSDVNTPGSSNLILNASGQFTATDLGELTEPAPR